jgi:hypothetical protein
MTGRPLAVKVAVFNAAARPLATAGVPVSDWPPEAHSIGIDGSGQHRPGGWNGHLIAVTGGHLIAGSLDQMSRPHRGITLSGPGVFPVAPEWGAPGSGALEFECGGGGVIMYEPIADGQWRRSVNWSRKASEIRQASGAAIRLLRAAQGSGADAGSRRAR